MILYNFNSNNLVNIAISNSLLELPEIFNSVYVYSLVSLYAVCTYVKRTGSSTCYVYINPSHYVYNTQPYFLSYIIISLINFNGTGVDTSSFNQPSTLIRAVFRYSVCVGFN